MNNSDINEIIEEYVEYLKYEKNYSNNTYESYERDVRDFLVSTNKEIIDISDKDIDTYIMNNLSKLTESTINRRIASIRSFFKYLNNYKGYINISDEVKNMKKKKTLPKYLTMEEVDRLLNINLVNKYDYRNKAMLELLYSTGLRASELINLDTTNIDFDNKILSVYGKGKKERIVPLSEIAIKYLKIYIYEYRSDLFVKKKPATDALFLNNHGERMTRQGLNLLLSKIAENAKIDKLITPHVLRHSFATHLIENGADIRSVQELLGHENIVTTEVYTHIADKYIKENYEEYFNRSKKDGEINV